MAKEQSSGEKQKKKGGPSLLEWISGAVGALLAIAILLFLTLEALDSGATKPPLLHVRPTAVTTFNGLYIVELTVTNRSGQTAAAVEVEGELSRSGRVVETSNATLSYVPGNSERKAGLLFTHDPRSNRLQVRATGYQQP